MADIRAMCATGQRGQLGLNGRLPWEGNKGREYVADVARFFEITASASEGSSDATEMPLASETNHAAHSRAIVPPRTAR